MGTMSTYRGYNNGYDNPVYNVPPKHECTPYTGKIRYIVHLLFFKNIMQLVTLFYTHKIYSKT